jgi:hypothetical protein
MTGFHSKREAAADKLQEPEREALKLALEALRMADELCRGHGVDFKEYKLEFDKDIQVKYREAITAIKEALAQPAQEPVNLLKARRIAAEYGIPNSQIDSGNLYFALMKCLEHIDAQPVQEPDALTIAYQSGFYDGKKAAQRPWVGLTDEEIEGLWKSRVSWTNNNFARAIEHLLKGKNS